MKIKLKRREIRALLKLLAEADESENGDAKPSKPPDEDDPYPISVDKDKRR